MSRKGGLGEWKGLKVGLIDYSVQSFPVSCKIPLQSTTAASHKKPYDPMQFTEKVDNGTLKEAHHKLKLLEFDYKALHDKRLQDVS